MPQKSQEARRRKHRLRARFLPRMGHGLGHLGVQEMGTSPKVAKRQRKTPLSGWKAVFLWSVRPIKMFAKTLYLQGFAGQRRLFFLFFGWDLADFLPKGDFSVRPKKISAYSYFFSF